MGFVAVLSRHVAPNFRMAGVRARAFLGSCQLSLRPACRMVTLQVWLSPGRGALPRPKRVALYFGRSNDQAKRSFFRGRCTSGSCTWGYAAFVAQARSFAHPRLNVSACFVVCGWATAGLRSRKSCVLPMTDGGESFPLCKCEKSAKLRFLRYPYFSPRATHVGFPQFSDA